PDRLFVGIAPSAEQRAGLDALAAAGFPVVVLPGEGVAEELLGGQVMLWEMATALVGVGLGINPFDQPNVAEAKAATTAVLDGGAAAVAPVGVASLLARVRPGDYVALQAYASPLDHGLEEALEGVRLR